VSENVTPILSLVDKDLNQMHFYADGTFTDVPKGMMVANYIPLMILRFKAIIREIANDYLPVIKGDHHE